MTNLEPELPTITLPPHFNYIAAFLTFSCQLRCTYCINHHGGDLVKGRWMSGEDWIKGLRRLSYRPDLPITFQGGEPTVYKDFYKLLSGIDKSVPCDLLTNLEVPLDTFCAKIPPERFKRVSPYASIRVSYHHGQSNFQALTDKVVTMLRMGYSIGIWEVDNPDYHSEVIVRQQIAHAMGIDYRLKEFLGPHGGKLHGTMRYPDSVNSKYLRSCECRTSELIIAPDGHIFRCHSDLYANRSAIGHILDPKFTSETLGQWQHCAVFGKCNSCDVKVKTNRFQQYGHSSVEIRNISPQSYPNKDYVTEVINTYGKPDASTQSSSVK